jgi:pimeloyl-ACP methyl ester carboxylesterase
LRAKDFEGFDLLQSDARCTGEDFMTRRFLRLRFLIRVFLISLLPALTCAAAQAPGPRIVNLAASDGTNLKATYFAAGNAGPGVLLLHQCNRQRKVWDDLAERLAVRGINMLALDLRGFGESGGTSFNQLSPEQQSQIVTGKWPGDIDTAFQYLEAIS